MHRGSVCSATTVHTILTEVEIRRTDGSLHIYIYIYNPAHVIYGGDLNTDLTRNTPHAYALRNFISDFNLTVCIDAPDAQVPYIYVSPNGLTSRIDIFLTTANLGQKV